MTATRRPSPGPWGSARIALTLSLGAFGVLQGACNCDLFPEARGWEIICNPNASYNGTLPTHICLNKNLEGGVNEESIATACAQAANDVSPGAAFTADTFSDPPPEHELDADDEPVDCIMTEHAFPVWELGGGAGDEVGVGPDNPNFNAIQCYPQVEIEIGDGDGSYQVAPLWALHVCSEPGWDEADALEACSTQCNLWKGSFSGYDTFTNPDGNCDTTNFMFENTHEMACAANEMQGSIWAAAAQVSFTDALNSISDSGVGVMAYDDSMCGVGGACEPEILLTFSSASMSFPFVDSSGLTYAVVATDVQLSTLHPVQTTQDPASGLLQIDHVEFDLKAEDATVDGVSVGPIHLRDIVGPVDLDTDPRSGEIVLTGTSELLRGNMRFTFIADPSRPTTWPAD